MTLQPVGFTTSVHKSPDAGSGGGRSPAGRADFGTGLRGGYGSESSGHETIPDSKSCIHAVRQYPPEQQGVSIWLFFRRFCRKIEKLSVFPTAGLTTRNSKNLLPTTLHTLTSAEITALVNRAPGQSSSCASRCPQIHAHPTGHPAPSSCTHCQSFLTFHPDILQDYCATSSCCSRKASSTRQSTPYVGATGNPRTCGCAEQFDELCRSVRICRNPQRLAAFFQRQTAVLADGCAVCSEDK